MKNDLLKFTNAYLSIITEAWDRYLYLDIICAVGLATNYGKDPWIKGETNTKIKEKINELAFHTKGRKLLNVTRVADNDINVNSDSLVHYNGSTSFDAQYVYNYWKFRAQKGDEYARSTFNLIHSIDPYGTLEKPRDVLATEIGLVSYAIWKAMNTRATKIQRNEQEIKDKNLDETYQAGAKVEHKKFLINDVYTDSYQFSKWSPSKLTGILVGEDPETGIKVKLKVTSKEGLKLSYVIKSAKTENVLDKIIPIEVVVEKATISKFDHQWKTVVFNRITFESPTLDEIETLEKRIYNLQKEIKEEKKKEAEKKAEFDEEGIKRTLQHVFNSFNSNDPTQKEKIISIFNGFKNLEKDGLISIYNAELFIKIFKEIFKEKFNEDLPEE